jgi:hypothetical protein
MVLSSTEVAPSFGRREEKKKSLTKKRWNKVKAGTIKDWIPAFAGMTMVIFDVAKRDIFGYNYCDDFCLFNFNGYCSFVGGDGLSAGQAKCEAEGAFIEADE